MVRLDNERFLASLTTMYVEAQKSGTVTLSMKKVTPEMLSKGPVAERVALEEPQACLVHAYVVGGDRAGSKFINKASKKSERKYKAKISTVLQGKDQVAFQAKFAEILRTSMDNMKRDRKKKKLKKLLQQKKRQQAKAAGSK